MRIALFCHSLISDWNHGNAHFLRGITADLLDRGHDVLVVLRRSSPPYDYKIVRGSAARP